MDVGHTGLPLYPHPCGDCGAAQHRPCTPQRRVVRGMTVWIECDGSDG